MATNFRKLHPNIRLRVERHFVLFYDLLHNNGDSNMQQSACLVINPIMVDGFAAIFNCTPVDRASDSMMAPA